MLNTKAQIVPPYIQYFDSVNCTGWTHGALAGNDDWQRGAPSGVFLNNASSAPKVWGTNLAGYVTSSGSVMFLATPGFDLSNLSKVYLLTFSHKYHNFGSSAFGGNIEYSTDGGVTWNVLNGTSTQKVGWYNTTSCAGLSGQPAWSFDSYSVYSNPAHSLISLQGQSDVRFRFKYGGTSLSLPDGWMIDDFSVIENVPDIVATPGIQYNGTKNFSQFDVVTNINYNGLPTTTFSNTTNYYFSYDSIYDASDALLGTKGQNINSSVAAYTRTFTMLPNLHARDYWVFYKHDALNNLSEFDETNNLGVMKLHLDTVFSVPDLVEDFEGPKDYWKASTPSPPLVWQKGYSNVHQIEGPHSGNNSWFIQNPKYTGFTVYDQYLESPYMDLTPANNNYICFWYRSKMSYTTSPSKLKMELSTTSTFPSYTSTLTIPMPRFNDWDCNCQSLTFMNGQNNAKLRFTHQDGLTYALFNQNMNVDDIFIGQPKPDLSIEHKNILHTPTTLSSDTLYYEFFNSGPTTAPLSTTEFYWSADSLLDAGDLLLGSVSEATVGALGYRKAKYVYTKPTTGQGIYFILYKVDATASIAEMRETNNVGYYKLKQDPIIPLPYYNDFETQSTGWWHNASIGTDNWQLSTPSGTFLTSAFSGSKAFNTTKTIPMPKMSRMHLYTPVFDFTTLSSPVIEFDMKLHKGGGCHCFDGTMNLSYSTDGGATWKVADTLNRSYNRWYNAFDYSDWGGVDQVMFSNYSQLFYKGTENVFVNIDQYNSRDADRNTRYILDVAQLAGFPHVQFRFNIANAANDTTTAWTPIPGEGVTIDNFSIRQKFIDLVVPYKKAMMISSLSPKIKFNMSIRNVGNYISSTAINKYYVSADSLLDASDFYLGADTIPYIMPDMKRYINRAFNAPSSLLSYKYFIYEIDATNLNAESNEINNTGFWPLAIDSVSTYPYFENFNDSTVNGWHEYLSDQYTGAIRMDQWRFRNKTAPAEPLYQSQIVSNQMFTDRINSGMPSSFVPFWNLESPAFDFTNYNSLELSFKAFVWGNSFSGTGGNFQYSLNGGNTWTVLNYTTVTQAYNWYNSATLSSLGGAGWTSLMALPALLDSVWFDLNFLSGQPNVMFKYKFRSNYVGAAGLPQGMRIDDFRITGNSVPTGVKNEQAGFTSIYAFEDNLYVNYGILSDPTNHYTLTITSLLGQKVYSIPVELNKGANEFILPDQLTDGMYLIDLTNGKNNLQQKIVVVK